MALAVGPLIEAGYPPVILASAEARPVLKDLTRADLPRLVVLSQREIPRDTPVEIFGTVVEEEPARRHDDLHGGSSDVTSDPESVAFLRASIRRADGRLVAGGR